MGKGLPRSLRHANVKEAPILRKNFTFNSQSITMTGATGVGWGTAIIGDLPQGNILVLGATFNGTITEASSNISNTFSGDIAVGSTPVTDGTATAGDVDVVPLTAVGPAVDSAATAAAKSGSTESGTILDNTDGALELNLNLLIDDADIGGNDPVTVTGTLTLSFIVLPLTG